MTIAPRGPAGFVAGTVVHVPGGVRRIDQLAAGDAALHEDKFEAIHGDTPPTSVEGEMRDGRICRVEFLSVIVATAEPDVGVDFDGSGYWFSDGAWGVRIHITPDGPRVERTANGGYADMYIGEPELEYENLDPGSVTFRSGGFPPLLRPVHCLEIEDGFGYYAGEDGLLVFGA